MIQDVIIKNLKKHKDDRGYLMEIIRRDDEFFLEFGQFYIAQNKAGKPRDKDWHYHNHQTDYFCCIEGEIKVALYDRREGSKTQGQLEFHTLNSEEPQVIRIPQGVLHIYKTIGSKDSLLINMTTTPYNTKKPDELRQDIKDLVPDFAW